MYIILGGTGHVGSAVASALLDGGDPVTIVTRDASKAADLERRGAAIAIADIHDADALRRVFGEGRRLFLLNPPADPSTDTDLEEKRTIASILSALDGSGLEKIVAQSTYGAQPGENIGDLGTLHGLEQGLNAQPIPTSILRAAYYMSNWDALLPAAREGVLPTLYPADFELPMVAPLDIGRAAADLLREPVVQTGLHFVEGPERHSPADVAAAMARALGRPVEVATAPRERWTKTFRDLGFSAAAARSFAGMTAVSLDGGFELPEHPMRGSVTLQAYVSERAAAAAPAGPGEPGA